MHTATRPELQATPFTAASRYAMPTSGSSVPPHFSLTDINDGAGLIKLDVPCFVEATGELRCPSR
jgi:hypothetical protein